jgi:hypothetical protein
VSRHRPNTVIVEFCGVPHSLDLLACRRALVQHQVEGEFFTLAALAAATEISRQLEMGLPPLVTFLSWSSAKVCASFGSVA